MSNKLLEVMNLVTQFYNHGQSYPVVDHVSFSVAEGEVFGIVGESGCGKSVTAKSVMRLISYPPAKIIGGEVLFDGVDLLQLSEQQMRHIRGNDIAMIFQEPMTSLNPVYTCGNQIEEALMLHQGMSRAESRAKAIEMLSLVGIPLPEKRVDSYPHELSGGMRQRVMIAMALSCQPKLLIADEPTTALDPTIQAQILELISNLQKKRNMSVIFITHDLGVVAETCDRVMVMYAGKVVEQADVKTLFNNPAHPYTQGLMRAVPRLNAKRERLFTIEGIVPHLANLPEGCAFAPRCPQAGDMCRQMRPVLEEVGEGHYVSCFAARKGVAENV